MYSSSRFVATALHCTSPPRGAHETSSSEGDDTPRPSPAASPQVGDGDAGPHALLKKTATISNVCEPTSLSKRLLTISCKCRYPQVATFPIGHRRIKKQFQNCNLSLSLSLLFRALKPVTTAKYTM